MIHLKINISTNLFIKLIICWRDFGVLPTPAELRSEPDRAGLEHREEPVEANLLHGIRYIEEERRVDHRSSESYSRDRRQYQ